MNRSRHVGDPRSVLVQYNQSNGDNTTFTATVQTLSQTIWDAGLVSQKVNSVLHNIIRQEALLPVLTRVHTSGVTNVVTPFTYGFPSVGTIESLFPGPSSPTVSAFADEAYEALYTQIPQEVSLPNFVYEFREIGSMLPELGETMAQTVSGGYLNFQFGWKPFIGDLQKLHNLMQIVRTRIEYLKSTYGKETRISYQKSFDVPSGAPSSKLDANSLLYTRRSYRGIFHCTGYLTHYLENLNGIEGLFRAAAGALGLNNPLGVVWEAIPFSFVVDWFTRIGSIVQHTAVQPFVGDWNVKKITWSFKVSGDWGCTQDFGSSWTPRVVTPFQGTWSQYSRTVGLPVADSLLSSSALDLRQQALAAALIHQNVR